MPNISLTDLQNILQKSGLPFGSSFDMAQAKPGAREAIAATVPNRSGDVRSKIMGQLAQIAQMDQKLGGVYSDPTSPMYIKNPVARDSASHIGNETMYKDVSSLTDQANTLDKQRESDISTAEQTYNELTTAKKALEEEAKKTNTDNTKQVEQKTIKDSSGNTVFNLSKAQTRQAQNANVNLEDVKAVSEFFNKSTATFRNFLEDEGINGKFKQPLTAKQIQDIRVKWQKDQKKKTTGTTDDFVKSLQDYAAMKK